MTVTPHESLELQGALVDAFTPRTALRDQSFELQARSMTLPTAQEDFQFEGACVTPAVARNYGIEPHF